MSWLGFFSYGGTEIINVERTVTYAKNDGAPWLHDPYKVEDLHLALGDKPYRSPLQDDDCPWTDPDDPDTYGFYGVYPLGVDGIESSTRTSTIVEATGDGGFAGKLRHTTKQIVFTTALMGESEAAVDAGLKWLRSVLLIGVDSSCIGDNIGGTSLCYFNAQPAVPVPETTLSGGTPYGDGGYGDGAYSPRLTARSTLPNIAGCIDEQQRFLYRVVVNNGPIVTQKNTMKDGSAVWQVQFTAVAGIPWEFGVITPVVTDFPQPSFVNIGGGDFNKFGYTAAEVACAKPSYTPVFDPACPDLVLPPTAPFVPLGCYTAPKNWTRRSFSIPADYIRTWTDVVPYITIRTAGYEVRNMRIRMYVDVDGSFNPDAHPCDHCADFLVSYVPPNGELIIDGRYETVEFLSQAQSRRADSLVYDSDHAPFEWPQLSCGQGFIVVVDSQQTQRMPYINFSLAPKSR